jgi:putative ABC transport system permease protein
MSPFKNIKTPFFANWLASKFIDESYQEELLGDLKEIYQDRIESKGSFYAKLMYWIDAIYLLKGFASLGIFKTQNNNTMMIRSMFLIAWRNALRQKQYTILNMVGLTLGISACLLIGLFVYDELSFDTFHSNADRIYRVNQPMIWNNWEEQFASTGPNVAVALKEDAQEFEEVTRILNRFEQIVRYNDGKGKTQSFREDQLYTADGNFFNVFSFDFVKGDPNTALKEPMSLVMTEETASRYFGSDEAVGSLIEIKRSDGEWAAYTVKGIIKDIPGNSHLQFDILLSMSSYSTLLDKNEWLWTWTGFSTYGLVKEGTDIDALTEKIQAIPPKWAERTTQASFNQSYEEYTAGRQWRLYLQPVKEIYLASEPSSHRFGPSGNQQSIKIFSAIGFLIILLSSINFMNLSTARSSNRAKEVGIRKLMGSERGSLIGQFIFESILFVLVSTLSAFLLVQVLLPGFNQVIEKSLELTPHFSNPLFLGIIMLFVLVLGILSGSYPAFYLSSFMPIQVLKGKINAGFKGKGVRNSLVIFQFSISIILIICTFFVQKQLAYTSSIDLGYNKANILQVYNLEQMDFNTEVLRNKLSDNPAFANIGISYALPPDIHSADDYAAAGPNKPPVAIYNFRAEEEYVDLLGLEFLAGRNFDPGRPTDKYGLILNEEAVKALGWGTSETFDTDSPIGKNIIQSFESKGELPVIGVVKNFNYNSVRQKIEPLIIVHRKNDKVWNYGGGAEYLSLRINPLVINDSEKLQAAIKSVNEEISLLDPSIPFEYSFMDEQFDDTFKSEQRMGTSINILTSMALIIACLGLFGLAAFSAEQRLKELGIRKVLGAKATQLVLLFSSEFSKLVGLAILVASPIAYLLVDYWLGDFAYRTPINIQVFVMAALSALTIALVTISFQSIRAALKNPVETLKDE